MKRTLYLGIAAAFLMNTGAAAESPAGRSSIVGKVVDVDGNGVPNANVRIVNATLSTRTGPSGLFRFDDLSTGEYLVDVYHPRLGQRAVEVTVPAANELPVSIQLERLYHMDEVVVTAGVERRRSEAYQGVSVLSNAELASRAASDLGETLAGEPGMSATFFGPGASRPVIRGLGGDRVRILEAGVTTGDVSDASPDHAVGVEPASADRIEIVRGPATLLYGSSAVGGVVNVIDGRIPRERPVKAFEGSIRGAGTTVSDEVVGGIDLRLNAGPIVLSVGGSRRDSEDYAIPGFAEAEHEEHEEEEPIRGLVTNSFVETTRGAIGASYVGRHGYVGAAWSGLDKAYGLPGGHDEGEHEEERHGEEAVTIDLEQRRLDLEGSWYPDSDIFSRVRARVGITDYAHRELEGDEVGTVFANDQWEARLEVDHRPGRRVSGTVGIQIGRRDFSAVGVEAFVPPSETDQLAVFVFEEFDTGDLRYQLGARLERQSASPAGSPSIGHSGLSLSGGARWRASDGVTIAVSAGRSHRLPSGTELFSNGPHLATRSFEIGNPGLDAETAHSLDVSARLRSDRVQGEVTGFVNAFDGFIFPDFTGAEEDGLTVLAYRQADATFSGVELSGSLEILHRNDHHVALTGSVDWVRATRMDTDTPVPRIPPLRVGAGFRYDGGIVRGDLSVTRHTRQDRVAPKETPTDGYTMVDAGVAVVVFAGDIVNEVSLRGSNLGDIEARNHVSLLKGEAPLPGRSLRLMYRLHF